LKLGEEPWWIQSSIKKTVAFSAVLWHIAVQIFVEVF